MSTLSLRKIKHDSSAVDNITLDSSGNVGVNKTTPRATTGFNSVSLNGTDGSEIWFDANNVAATRLSGTANETRITAQASGSVITMFTGATERVRVDNSGCVTMPYQPCFMATSTDTANTITSTKLNFNTIGQANAVGYNTTNQRFTAPVSGKYLFMCNIWFYNTGYSNQVVLRVNNNELNWSGDTHIMCNGSNSVDCMTGGSTILQLSAGDYVELFARNGYTVRWYGRHSSWAGHLVG